MHFYSQVDRLFFFSSLPIRVKYRSHRIEKMKTQKKERKTKHIFDYYTMGVTHSAQIEDIHEHPSRQVR